MLEDMDVEKTLSGLYVVIVDDDEILLRAHERNLGGAQYGILTFDDPTEAVDAISAEKNIAMVVTDLQMPNICGDDLLKFVREMQPHAVRLLMSGNYKMLQTFAEKDGLAHHYMRKPYEPQDFRGVVGDGVERYLFNKAHGIR